MKRVMYAVVLSVACAAFAAQQETTEVRFEQALDAWSYGNYIAALEEFQTILKSLEANRYFERIALTTGELYQVTEVARDGRSPRFSPSGRYAAFDVGSRTSPVTRIIEVENRARTVADVPGINLVFSPGRDTVAYLHVNETPEIKSLRKEIEGLASQASPDRQALAGRQRRLSLLEAKDSNIVVRDLRFGEEWGLADGGLLKGTLAFSADGHEVYFVGAKESDTEVNEIYAVSESAPPRTLTSGPGFKTNPIVVPGGRYIIYSIPSQSPFSQVAAGEQRGRPGGPPQMPQQFAILNLVDETAKPFAGSAPTISSDGSALAFLARSGSDNTIQYVKLDTSLEASAIKKSPERISSVSLSADGSRAVYDMVYTRNQEIFCIRADGTLERRLTREIQNDRAPRFITGNKVLAIKGEPRHSRSYLYDINTLASTKLFHNNTIRTIAPEYEWASNPDGTLLLIQAERDGDTISPERGIYLLDLTRKITVDDLLARIQSNLAAERDLRAQGEAMFRPIAEKVQSITGQVSVRRIYEYEEALFNLDSKHISQPGNKPAGEYIFNQFGSFGYQPEYRWFTSGEIRTANVLATLRGTENPELIYVVSSHYDSNQRGPGADDNSSSTAVLLETARLMARTPMPATVIFAAFTGEEAGLLGSREFVRQAIEKKLPIVGALNNDMIGWTNDYRLDNTIRYSNAGIRDLQHAASFLFSRMITYDARYFKATDAAAYYDAYGDIVGGFGSYPVVASPYYHQPTDLLETVNQQLLVEAAKANIASIMLLASSPSRIKDLKIGGVKGDTLEVSWTPSPEMGISDYTVAYGVGNSPISRIITVKEPRARLTGFKLKSGETLHVAVKAHNIRGLAGWDWARATITVGQ
jgi:Tol biopolymer transport system component